MRRDLQSGSANYPRWCWALGIEFHIAYGLVHIFQRQTEGSFLSICRESTWVDNVWFKMDLLTWVLWSLNPLGAHYWFILWHCGRLELMSGRTNYCYLVQRMLGTAEYDSERATRGRFVSIYCEVSDMKVLSVAQVLFSLRIRGWKKREKENMLLPSTRGAPTSHSKLSHCSRWSDKYTVLLMRWTTRMRDMKIQDLVSVWR